jgi:porin
LSALAIGPRGAPISNDVVQAFDGVMIVGSGKLTVKPFGLVGHQSLRFTWKNTERFSLDQDPSNIARVLLNERFPRLANPGPVLTQILANSFPGLPVPTQPANRKNSSWSMNYAFDQYFRQPDGDPKHGVGLFFAFGTSDGNPDPIQYAFLAGIGGKGVVPGPPPTTALASASPGPSSATVFFPFCASSSTSACNARMRSRCTTTWQLRRG